MSTAATIAGKVLLLTTPVTSGYTQNPISVYYCYSSQGTLSRCIAEVSVGCKAEYHDALWLCSEVSTCLCWLAGQ